jgi:hypothetical protein
VGTTLQQVLEAVMVELQAGGSIPELTGGHCFILALEIARSAA